MAVRRIILLFGFVVPIGLAATAFVALALASPLAQTGTPASGCAPDLRKWAEPESLVLGQTAKVSLVVSGTCPVRYMPVDLIIVADESNSMTRGRTGMLQPTARPSEGPPPDPSAPPPTPEPPPGIGTPDGTPGADPRGSEPPFCNPGAGIGIEPTMGRPTEPATPDPSQEPPRPTPPGGVIPPTTPGSGVEPPPNIEALEPSGGRDWVREEKTWIQDFMSQPEIMRDIANGRLRIGFISFNERARVRQPLTDSLAKVSTAANRMRGGEVTWVQQGLRAAEQMLNGSGSRRDADRRQVIILLSDFQFCQKDVRPVSRDIELIAVGFGVRNYDRRKLYELATDRRFVLESREVRRAIDLYEDVVAQGNAVSMTALTVSDELDERMALVPGSALPPTVTVTGQLLEWTFTAPTLPMTLSYRVEPLQAGLLEVSARAGIDWTDSETLLGSSAFPTVTLEVLAPTPTPTSTPTITPSPTATATPTATPTPTPGPRYLPLAYREPRPPTATPLPTATVCVPSAQTVDVAIVIDTSTSMNQPTRAGGLLKIDAAINAARGLVEWLKDEDQTTIVWFNNTAGIASQLTVDKETAVAALRGLRSTSASGTALHLGIRAATQELTSERHNPASNTSLVLLTDGRQTHVDGTEPVLAAARAAKEAGITVVTVGLGTDLDEGLLIEIASEPELYFPAPNAEDLEQIYIKIADLIPCR